MAACLRAARLSLRQMEGLITPSVRGRSSPLSMVRLLPSSSVSSSSPSPPSALSSPSAPSSPFVSAFQGLVSAKRAFSTADSPNGLCLVTRIAPDFTADAVMPNGEIQKVTLSEVYRSGSGVVLLFYPLDFTFVCPSEILAFNAAVDEFEALGFKVWGVSVDSAYTHQAWTRTAPAEGGIGQLRFPLVSDLDKTISRKFHSLLNNSVALRTLAIVDKTGTVRHLTVNDLPLGRSVEEALRVCEMIREVEKNGGKQVCPANWRRGEKMMHASFEGVKNYLGQLKN
ncbi:peroxiredoxin PRX3 [Toxoplasma gondii RUB]|uniref:Peroxiredoxin PRX3 n=1 Tax=Toxoplasma gondii RUB TaxID=935652 RepID=A0A086M3V6_TOXGO|nr:peroxiredoxin PRX3 [Toxoplasma gondii RUB]